MGALRSVTVKYRHRVINESGTAIAFIASHACGRERRFYFFNSKIDNRRRKLYVSVQFCHP